MLHSLSIAMFLFVSSSAIASDIPAFYTSISSMTCDAARISIAGPTNVGKINIDIDASNMEPLITAKFQSDKSLNFSFGRGNYMGRVVEPDLYICKYFYIENERGMAINYACDYNEPEYVMRAFPRIDIATNLRNGSICKSDLRCYQISNCESQANE
jgi:hypothetical protein